MQNQKPLSTRVLSLALTAAMVATMMPQAVFAEGTAPIDASGVTTTRTITAAGELGEGFAKPVPFDGHTYMLDVKANTPFAEVKLPTELSVTVEKTTTKATTSSKDEMVNLDEATSTAPGNKPVEPTVEPITEPATETPVASEATNTKPATTTDATTTVLGNEPATPSGAEPAPVEKTGNTTVIETTQENVPVTWKGDKEYTAKEDSNVVYTAVLPEGYALKDGVILPIINVKVGKKVMTPKPAMSRAGTDIATGTSGTCSWVIDSAGVLTISPTSGQNGILAYSDAETLSPWNDNKAVITSVVVKPGVATGTSAAYLFADLIKCTKMNLSALDTSAATNMAGMFIKCEALPILDLSNFNTAKVTDMSNMFNRCRALTTLDLSHFNTANVTAMDSMFRNCNALTSLDVSSFNTAKVTDMGYMFRDCNVLTSLDVSKFDTTKVTTMQYMFRNCSVLPSLNVSNFNTANVTTMRYMFNGCTALTSLNLSRFDTTNVTTMLSMFNGCTVLKSLNVSKFNTANVTDMYGMFYKCKALTSLDLSSFVNTNVTDMNSMFSGCTALITLTLSSNFDTTSVTDMFNMFYDCNALTSLDLSSFNTVNVTDMTNMFTNCFALKSLNVSSFNTTNVTAIYGMFANCNALTSLDVSKFDTSKATDINDMFTGCIALKSLNLSSFNTSAITIEITNLFKDCNSIESIQFGANFNKAVPLPPLLLAGKEFKGWYTNVKGTETLVFDKNGGSYTNPANTTVYTKWISFDPTIAVAVQNGTASYGTSANPTFTITSSNFGGTYPAFAPKFEWVGTAPTGVTTAFSPDNATLTVTTTAETPAGDYTFKVVSAKTGGGNYESAVATLTVGKREVAIAWDTNSFVYDGTSHKPTATVGNKVGTDDVTVTVTGEQTNVGTGITATAGALTGTAAGNYKLPTDKPTTTYAITAKTVTVNDGNLEVKKPHDGGITAGTATGNLGLTGVLAADEKNVSVNIDTVGAYPNADVGKNKTVTLTISLKGTAASNYTLGSVTTYEFTKAEITKKAYAGIAATAPNASNSTKTDTTVTLDVQAIDGETVEYGYSDSVGGTIIWQNSNVFTKLKANTDYYFFARVKENDTHAPGGVSSHGTSITTDKSVYTGAQATAPEKIPASKTDTIIILKTVTPPTGETVQYGIDKDNNGTITWQNGTTFNNLTVGTVYKFYTRVTETNTHKAGKTSAETTIKTKNINTTVDGKVTNSGGSPLEGAIVELKQGDTAKFKATTGADGKYTFANVPEGVYSLVITNGTGDSKITITDTITVAGKAITNKNMQFLDGSKNTVVQSAPGTPEVAVSKMNDLLTGENLEKTLTAEEKTAVDGNGSVELKFTANVKPLSEGTADKNAIEAGVAGSQKIDLLLDLSVTKTVKDDKDTIIADGVPIHKLAKIIEVHLPIPEELQGKSGLSLYRMHNDKAEKLGQGIDNAVDGEYYTIDDSGTFMTLYIMKFSTYAMGHDAFTAKIIDGGTGASGNGNYSNGDTVTINAGSKSGYAFSGWTVTTGGVTLVDPNSATTTFVMPIGAVTVTANWTSTGGGTGGNPAPQVYYYINATTSKGGSINTPERVKVIAGGSASFTITPDKGYQIADVLVNGNSIGAKNSYVFTNVNADQTIHATFKKAGHRNPQTGVDANVD